MGLFFVYFVLLKHKFKCRLQRNLSSGCRNADHNIPLFYILIKQLTSKGRGGVQVVIVLAFYSDNSSSKPADVYSFFLKNFRLK